MRGQRGLNIIVAIVAVGVWAVGAHAQQGGMSADDLLEYTLIDLQEKIKGLVDQNQQLAGKNDALRKRMIFIRDESRSFSDRRTRLMEEAAVMRNTIKAEGRELDGLRKHAANILERQRFLTLEKDGVAQRIERETQEQRLAQQTIEALTPEIKVLKERGLRRAPNELLDYYSEERVKLREMVQDVRRRIFAKEGDADLLDVERTHQLGLKEKTLRQRSGLEERASLLRLEIREAEDQYALLERHKSRYRSEGRSVVKEAELKVAGLRQYSQSLREASADMARVRREITADFDRQAEALERLRAQVREHNELLRARARFLEIKRSAEDGVAGADHQRLVLVGEQEQLAARQRILQSDSADIGREIAAQEAETARLRGDMEGLKAELAVMASRVAGAAEETGRMRQKVFGSEYQNLLAQRAKQRFAEETREAVRKAAEREMTDRSRLLERVTAEETSLSQRLKELETDVAEGAKQAQVLAEERDQAKVKAVENKQAREQALAALRARQKALKGSLEIAQQKYRADSLDRDEAAMEMKELASYLEILEKENRGLVDKLGLLEAQMQ